MPLLLLQFVTKTCQLDLLNSCLSQWPQWACFNSVRTFHLNQPPHWSGPYSLSGFLQFFPKANLIMSSPCLITCSIFAFRVNFRRVQHSKILLFQGPSLGLLSPLLQREVPAIWRLQGMDGACSFPHRPLAHTTHLPRVLSAYLTSLPPRFLRFPYSFTHPHTNQGGLAFQCKSLYRSSSSVAPTRTCAHSLHRSQCLCLRCLAQYLEYRKHYIHFFIGEVIIISFPLSCFFLPFSYSLSYLIYFSTHLMGNDCVTGSGLDAEGVSNSVPTLKELASLRANPPGKQTGGVWCAR